MKKIIYSQTWEDYNVIKHGLNLSKGKTIVSIGSSGDNIFAMLLEDPKKIYCVDSNPAQIALIELKMRAFENLTYDELLILLGIKFRGVKSLMVYDRLRNKLSEKTRAFWDQNRKMITHGIINCGEHEKKLRIFRFLSNLFIGKMRINKLVNYSDLKKQRRKFDSLESSFYWKALYKLMLSKIFLKKIVIYPAYDRVIKQHYKNDYLNLFRDLFYNVPMEKNYFIHQLFLGRYLKDKPAYLQLNNLDIIKARISRIVLLNNTLNESIIGLKPNSIDGFHLADAIEWLDKKDYNKLMFQIRRCSKNNARLLMLDCFLDNSIPDGVKNNFIYNDKLSQSLKKFSMAPFYNAIHIFEVIISS